MSRTALIIAVSLTATLCPCAGNAAEPPLASVTEPAPRRGPMWAARISPEEFGIALARVIAPSVHTDPATFAGVLAGGPGFLIASGCIDRCEWQCGSFFRDDSGLLWSSVPRMTYCIASESFQYSPFSEQIGSYWGLFDISRLMNDVKVRSIERSIGISGDVETRRHPLQSQIGSETDQIVLTSEELRGDALRDTQSPTEITPEMFGRAMLRACVPMVDNNVMLFAYALASAPARIVLNEIDNPRFDIFYLQPYLSPYFEEWSDAARRYLLVLELTNWSSFDPLFSEYFEWFNFNKVYRYRTHGNVI